MIEPLFRVSETASGDRIRQLDTFVRSGDLVPVERCVHGNIYPHQITEVYFNERLGHNDIDVTTCPGAEVDDE